MNPGYIFGALAPVFFLLGFLYDRGYRRGKKEGYDEGVQDGFREGKLNEEAWWYGAESEVDRERVKIWREEERKTGTEEERWP